MDKLEVELAGGLLEGWLLGCGESDGMGRIMNRAGLE